ncbi:SET domain-containing protein 5 [Madurella mycetomatis]|uniref:SET domain-containing protein 5 n=1 Tax=Madurella mycetomatis TaxID=100816 RepID=A0A175VPI8_9PEZI|nr:SET domain-containing protein 5 [Madurella mycetomatis]KXX76141.1 SET domain-containing protein 5 [Madurella mycetomatis]
MTGHFASFLLVISTLAVAGAIQTRCPWDPIIPSLRPSGSCGIPVDDDTDGLARENENVPWTQHPYCVAPLSTGSTEKFCVYSSSAFNYGSGVSLITTPRTAASIASEIQDPLPAWRFRRHLAHQGQLGTEVYDLPYAVTPIPGKGLGVVATKHIKQFEVIMTSFPAIIADNEFFPSEGEAGPIESPRLFQKALDQLPDKERFLALARSKGDDFHLVEDLIRTNAFGITVGGRDAKGVYPEIARLNHACDPNAFSKFTSRDLTMSAVATRDIMPGEEITISYIPLGMPTSRRHKALRNWGFNCTCDLCSAPSEAREASDRRRGQLFEVYYAIQEESTEYHSLVKLTREFIDLAQKERLIAKMGEYYRVFMGVYFEIGDLVSAKKYGQAALKLAEIFSDPEGVFCTGLRHDLGILERVLSDRQ